MSDNICRHTLTAENICANIDYEKYSRVFLYTHIQNEMFFLNQFFFTFHFHMYQIFIYALNLYNRTMK